MSAILASEPPPVSAVRPMSPPALDRLVKTCLAKDPDARWQTAHDVGLQLQGLSDACRGLSRRDAGGARPSPRTVAPVASGGGGRRPRRRDVGLDGGPTRRIGGSPAAAAPALGASPRRGRSGRAGGSGHLARRAPPRVRGPGRVGPEPDFHPVPRQRSRDGAARHGRRLPALLVAGQPIPGVLRAGQAQDDRRERRPKPDDLRRRGLAGGHLEPRWHDPVRAEPASGAPHRAGLGRRSEGRSRRWPAAAGPLRTGGPRSSCPTGGTISICPTGRRPRIARFAWGRSTRRTPGGSCPRTRAPPTPIPDF